MAKDTHVTKDGRTVKKGLYYYMNRAKKSGKSKPGKGTVTDKALAQSAKTAYSNKKKKKTMVGQEIIMPHTPTHKNKDKKDKNKNLAAMYGDKNVVTRGDVIAAAIKNKKKNTLLG